ncbi:guanine deaminase [Alteromonadaceae bacterium M269]|nr:guanine deaminase [Alteromonadaceae bacterium M269]
MITIFRASILHFPKTTNQPDADFEYFADGMLVVEDAKIKAIGPSSELTRQYEHIPCLRHDYSGKLLIPGLIDSHLHFPQTEMIACYGEKLLDWLENYTFPTERKFAEPEYASKVADIFLDQLLRNGTTTGLVYSTVHKSAADSLFSAAQQKNMCLVAGKVCMDRNCPDWLQDTAEKAQRESAELIEQWHEKDRLYYALTPRFAPTSTEKQLALIGELAEQYPSTFIQTHLSEDTKEIDWVKSLFPSAKNYLDVYEQHHLVRKRAVFGHCLHLENEEWQLLKEREASIAFCPTSNLFLGSGLFDYERSKAEGVSVGLATDVGAGTSFSLLKTMGEAYKVCQLQNQKLSALSGLYLMTQGAATALDLQDKIGNLNPGTDADFVVLEPKFDALTELRLSNSTDPKDILFALSLLGDDRAINSTWVAGELAYKQKEAINAMA